MATASESIRELRKVRIDTYREGIKLLIVLTEVAQELLEVVKEERTK